MKRRTRLLFARVILTLATFCGWTPPRQQSLQEYFAAAYPAKWSTKTFLDAVTADTSHVTTIEQEMLLGLHRIGGVDDPSIAQISKYEKTGCIWEAPRSPGVALDLGFLASACEPKWVTDKASRFNELDDALQLLDCQVESPLNSPEETS